MDDASRRAAAFSAATDISLAIGLACPNCIATMAEKISAYIATGDVAFIPHLDDMFPSDPAQEPAEPTEGTVVPFSPKKPLN